MDDGELERRLAELPTLDLVVVVLARLAGDVPEPGPALEPGPGYLALLAQRADSLYSNVDFSFGSPTPIAPILALRPLIELAILVRWSALKPELHGFLYMADSEALDLANLKRFREHAARRGSTIVGESADEEALKAAIRAEGFRRLAEAGLDFGKGRLVPKVEEMVKDVIKAQPGYEIAMRDCYEYGYRVFSPWEHSSGSSFKVTAQRDGDSWRWAGDRSPFADDDIRAIAASMYAFVLETVMWAMGNTEGAAFARSVRDYVTIHWVRPAKTPADNGKTERDREPSQ